jgi:hypothetical protein
VDIRKLAVNATIAGLVALAGAVAPAAATTALRTDPGGALLSGATTITATPGGTLLAQTAGTGTSHCTEVGFSADVRSSSSATSITGTLTALTFTSCNGFLGLTTFESCRLSPGSPLPTVHVTAGAGGGTVALADVTLKCAIMNSTSAFCYYTASTAAGNLANGPSTLTYSSVALVAAAGSDSLGAPCGSSGSWNWTFTHIVQAGTNRTVTVTTS